VGVITNIPLDHMGEDGIEDVEDLSVSSRSSQRAFGRAAAWY
jgi:hypothetical protein